MANKKLARKFFAPWVWINFILMVIIICGVTVFLWNGIDIYTNHGQTATVPKVKGMLLADAKYHLAKAKLKINIVDSTYNVSLPSGVILEQVPVADKVVKPGRSVEVVISTQNAPTQAIPDVIDNCSLRETEARLTSMGLKVAGVEWVPGQKEWVMGLKINGKDIKNGERVSMESPITIVAGSGTKDGVPDSTRLKSEKGKDSEFNDIEEIEEEIF